MELVEGGITPDAHNGVSMVGNEKKRVVSNSPFLTVLEHRQRRPQQHPTCSFEVPHDAPDPLCHRVKVQLPQQR